uniref:Uncharacterized protein n=1 Tax=viral metagenome TaxID=1070528 RepID=A0A6C0K4C7_9ZZZZ
MGLKKIFFFFGRKIKFFIFHFIERNIPIPSSISILFFYHSF